MEDPSKASASEKSGDATKVEAPRAAPFRDDATRLIAHYKILRELGRGGQGTVFLAEDSRLHRRVALKLLVGNALSDGRQAERFRREAETASKLDHPSICPVYDAGTVDGVAYIVMPYLEGETLAARIRRSSSQASPDTDSFLADFGESATTGSIAPPLSATMSARSTASAAEVARFMRIIEKSARALDVAHEAGIIHRDIKPSNIMLKADDEPVILDFGLAHRPQDDPSEKELTLSGEVFGTPAYMAPEQVEGRRGAIDRRTDVYALGVSLYEAVTGKRPFEAPTLAGLYREILSKAPTDPRTLNRAVSKDLKTVIETAIERDPLRRYRTAKALADDLAACREHRPIAARPIGPIGRTLRFFRREPAKAAFILLLAVAAPTIAVFATLWWSDRDLARRAAESDLLAEQDELLGRGFFELSELAFDAAVRSFSAADRLGRGSWEARLGLALLELNRNRPEEAVRILDTERRRSGDSTALRMLSIDAFDASNRPGDARAAEKDVPEPRTAIDHFFVGVRLLNAEKLGRSYAPQAASRHFDRALLMSRTPRALFLHAAMSAAGRTGDRDRVRTIDRVLLDNWPESSIARSVASAAYRDCGLFAESLANAVEADRLSPNDAVIVNIVGTALAETGKFSEAEKAFRRALDLDPADPRPHHNLGLTFQRLNRKKEAIEAYRTSLQKGASLAIVGANLSMLLDDPTEAAQILDATISAAPRSIAALVTAAERWESLGRGNDAVPLLERAFAIAPDSGAVARNYAQLLRRRGRIEDAISTLRSYLDKNPRDPEAWIAISGCLADENREMEALAALVRAEECGAEKKPFEYPIPTWLEKKRREASDESRLFDLALSGKIPQDPQVVVRAATVAAIRGKVEIALRWFEEAFEEDDRLSTDMTQKFGITAAGVYLAAASSFAKDRADRLSSEARSLLADNLAVIDRAFEAGRVAPASAARELARWRAHSHFASTRSTEAGSAWRDLWKSIDERIAFYEEKAREGLPR